LSGSRRSSTSAPPYPVLPAVGLTECFLTSSIIPNIDKRKLCELACQNGTDASTCRGTSEFAHMVGLPEGGMSLRPGSPCDNFQVNCY